jgi:hypothetical protein
MFRKHALTLGRILGTLIVAFALLTGAFAQADGDTNDIDDGSFEFSSLSPGVSPWTVFVPDDITSGMIKGQALAVQSMSFTDFSGTELPVEGNWFAWLTASNVIDIYSTISQIFTANPGDVIEGWAFFKSYQQFTSVNDDAYVRILDENGQIVAQVFTASVATAPRDPNVPTDRGRTPWTHWQHAFDASGTYTIEAGVRNVGYVGDYSAIGLDAIKLTRVPPPPPPDTRSATTLSVSSLSGRRGAKVSLSATLTQSSDGAKPSGKAVVFTVDGQAVGTATTDRKGVAKLSFTIPRNWNTGSYPIGASFDGDDAYKPATGAGTLTVSR